MAKQIQLRKGTATEHNTFTGANGEVTVDTTNKTLRVHDGYTVGGTRLATLTWGVVPAAQLPAASLTNQGIVILNNTLTSASTTEALTAAQGRVLKDTLDTVVSSSFGVGQTWQRFTSERAANTTYTNSTGKPLEVMIVVDGGSSTSGNTLQINSVNVAEFNVHSSMTAPFCFTVPAGQTYRMNVTSTIISWSELR